MKGFYAFWKYDLFPFVLGGPITKMLASGAVETENYGPGTYFVPFKILPPEVGEKLLKELKGLEDEYRAASQKLKNEFVKKRNKLIEVPK